MASAVSTFGLSLAVSVISILFISKQSTAVTRTLERHYRPDEHSDPETNHDLADAQVPTSDSEHRPLYESPDFAKAWITQALDVATNFPSAILTIVAYTELCVVPPSAVWIFIVAAVLVTLGTVWLANPRMVGPYVGASIHDVSAYSVLLFVLNLGGFIAALA